MRRLRYLASLSLLLVLPLHAQALSTTCHARSSYDMTLTSDRLLFDRASPAPDRVELQRGALRTDGVVVRLNAEDEDRLTLFEQQLRALVPRVRAIARQGVALAVQVMHEQAQQMNLSPQTRVELDRRLAARAAELRQRIDASNSTHDWQGEVAQQYANQVVSDLAPLVAGDLGQQALSAAISGDLDSAARLRDEASDLATRLQPRIEHRLRSLQPQVNALCPELDRLAELQQGVRGANGQPLRLLQVDPR